MVVSARNAKSKPPIRRLRGTAVALDGCDENNSRIPQLHAHLPNSAHCRRYFSGCGFLHPTGLAPVREARTQLPPESIVRAVTTSDPALLDFASAEGVNVNAVDAEGRTALSVAVTRRDRAMAQRLLALNADVDVADKAGRTPLMTAAREGDLEILEALLARSRHPEATDTEGRTAAHYAIEAGQYGPFDLLLPRLPEVDEPAADGRDLLALAFDSGNPRMIKAVL